MQRIPEPELMTDDAQCEAYASADFGVSNQAFVNIVRELIPKNAANVLDLGCGPGDVMIRLARACPSLKITAIDGSPVMIQLAQAAIEECGLSMAISARQGYVPAKADDLHRCCVRCCSLPMFSRSPSAVAC